MLERDQISPELAALYDVLLAQRGVVPNMFKTVANHPNLALTFAAFLKSLLSDGALPGWYKELIAARIASEQQIVAMKSDFERGPFTEAEKLGLRCADRLHHSANQIDDDFYAKLQSVYNDQQIIELIATASAFQFFPRFVDALRIPLTPLPEKPSAGQV